MYPALRVLAELRRVKSAPRIGPGEPHAVFTRCWPTDIDLLWELNNGRSLTLMDIGRMSVIRRAGIMEALSPQGLRVAVAGSSVTYRRRVRLFEKMEIRSVILGMDARFFYVEQLTLASGEPAHGALYRMVCFGAQGMAAAPKALEGMSHPGWKTPVPDWVSAWASADKLRPWPSTLAEPASQGPQAASRAASRAA